MKNKLGQPRTIAVFRALQLGDLLCLIPAARALRHAFPHAEITLISLPWARSFVQRFSRYFDRFVSFPGYPGLPEQPVTGRSVVTFLKTVQGKRYDAVIQMQGNGTIVNSLVELFGAKQTAGFFTEWSYRPDTRTFMKYPEQDHELVRLLKLVEFLGAKNRGKNLEFPMSLKERQNAARFLREQELKAGTFVCLHPGARDPRRRWNPKNFAKVADAISAEGFKVVLTGTAEESSIIRAVLAHAHSSCVDASGIGLGELAAVLEQARLLVCNDTGVSHVAAALKIPSVIIFSPYSDPDRWAPLNKKLNLAVPHQRAGAADFVIAACLKQLKSSRAVR